MRVSNVEPAQAIRKKQKTMSGIPPGGDRRDPRRVDRRKHPALSGHLELLSRMSGHLAVTLNIEDTIQKALDLIVQFVKAEAGSLFLLENNATRLNCKASVGPVNINGLILQADEGIIGQCVTENRSRMVRDASHDPDFDQSIDDSTGFHTRSILCAPMNVQDTRVGAIELINKEGSDGLFSEPDLLMLQTLAAAAALAIRNARMAEELVEQERVSREIELAIEMQRSLLPKPRTASFPVSGINLPAYEVSGDFYDYFELEDGRIYFSLGDVSGKGMDAALLMSKTASLFRCLGKTMHEPGALLATINKELCETAINGMFVTMVCGIFNPVNGEVRLANTGHEPPLVRAPDGTFRALPASAPPLGILPLEAGGDGILDEILTLGGGTLFIFTDGVTEGDLGSGRRMEVEGLMNEINDHSDQLAVDQISAVVKRLQNTGQQRHDDITLLAVDDLANKPVGNTAIPLTRLTFRAQADELHRVREAVRQAAERCGCTPELTQDLVIAIGEASQNVVRHAYKDVEAGVATLEILHKKGILEFRLLDSAPPVDREKVIPVWPEDIKPGGLGICLIHDIMDKVEFLEAPSGNGNLLRMVKYLENDTNET
jgi:sigma-B regulation protein RsbU (phosphoserine phosphatase)